MAGLGKEYVIGKGRLFFDQFAEGTFAGSGELYLGNTPELSKSADSETLDHFDADEGLNVKDESVTTSSTMTLTFSTDNISADNLALWFAGPQNALTITNATGETDTFEGIKLGRFYQLGVNTTTPSGARNITNVAIEKDPGGTPTAVVALNNWEADLENGRIYIEPDAADLIDGDDIEVTYDISAGSRTVIIGRGDEIRGALRFISNNPVGGQRNYFYPYVKLTSNGDYALKGDEWQVMSFNVEVLKKDSTTERVYIDVIS